MEEKEGKVVKLCTCGQCCPEVEIGDSGVIIRDDLGGKVELTKEEWKLLKRIDL